MALGTLDRSPPPFFRQGHSALTKLVFFSALAVFLMVADTRLQLIEPLRAGLATVLFPGQLALKAPVDGWRLGSDYLRNLQNALDAEREAREKLALQAERLARAEQLESENARLRALLDLPAARLVRSFAAEVLFEASDPFSRKLFVDRGLTHGMVVGAPVINEDGVLGQVTRVYPLSSEVTLLVDKDAAIPVLNTRTQQRGVAFGGAGGTTGMELRFMADNTDILPMDTLVTSGIDGVYPAGLAVASVSRVTRQGDGGFARVLLSPSADPDGVRHVLVLEPVRIGLPDRPDTAPRQLRNPEAWREGRP
jgi:rod shape-determining protein MreC